MTRRTRTLASKSGFTLFEILLALGISVFVIGALAMVIDLHLRAVQAGRIEVEEAQLARALLGRIADDIRCAVRPAPKDAGNVSSMMASSGSSSSSGGSGSSGSGSSGSGSSGSGSSSSGSGSSSSGSSAGGGTSGSGTSGTSGGSGGTGGSTGTGGSASSGSGSTTTSSTTTGSTTQGSSTTSPSEGVAESTEPPLTPGLYGNQYELLVDVSRLPRPDQLNAALQAATTGGAVAPPSDVKNIAYYVLSANDVGAAASSATFDGQQGGLVRRELDRAQARLAMDAGQLPTMDANTPPIAPEVVRLEFRYFDGTEWVTSWDSNERQGLPMAVEIAVWVQSAERMRRSQRVGTLAATLGLGQEIDLTPYRLVVALPGAEPTTLDAASTSSEDTGSPSSSDSSSSGSSSGASSTNNSTTPGTGS